MVALTVTIQPLTVFPNVYRHTGWQAVRDAAMWYIQKKKAGNFNMKYAATYNLLDGKETIP